MDPIEFNGDVSEEMTLGELLAAAVKQIEDRPKSAAAWLEQKRPDISDLIAYASAVDQTHGCEGCGGTNGVVVSVATSEELRGVVVLHLFRHSVMERPSVVQFHPDDARELVNRLMEAISASDRLLAAR